jgi:3-oxoacyl-[acyl-carrier protein] reductase
MKIMKLQNKKALITGASRGIGYAVAELFLKEGAQVAICATNEAALARAVKTLIEAVPGGRVFAKVADVSQNADCEALVEAVVKEFGGLDILVNNAGITRDNLAVRMSEEDFDAVIDVNLKGTFLMSKAALKVMMKARSGSIVNMSSIVGQSGNAGQANYSASKAGIIGLSEALAKEFASRNIRVNAVAPGFVSTEMTCALKQETQKQILENIPLKRFAETSDIAKAVMFLACDDAGYITGQTLAVNGGLYI